jgi:hypothetical protein
MADTFFFIVFQNVSITVAELEKRLRHGDVELIMALLATRDGSRRVSQDDLSRQLVLRSTIPEEEQSAQIRD